MQLNVCNCLPSVMEVSLKPQLNRPNSIYKGTFSHIRDFCYLPLLHISQSLVLHHSSTASIKRPNFGSVHSFGQGNGGGLPNHHHCSWSSATYIPMRKASHPHSLKPCQVKSEDSDGTLSGDSILIDEQTLEHELQIAIVEENYARAAKIRDTLRVLQEDGKASVLAANARFYNSFRNGDLAAMQTLWAKGENVCVVHPGVSGISGYDLVMGSWEFVWADYEFPLDIEIKDAQVHVRGDVGYVTCIELFKTKSGKWGRQFATNVFERIGGQWFICIHHASHVDV